VAKPPVVQPAFATGFHLDGMRVGTCKQTARAAYYLPTRIDSCYFESMLDNFSILEIVYRRLAPRLGHNQTIGAIAHRQCRLIWIILHRGVGYVEHGPAVQESSKRARTSRMIRQLRNLGYRVELLAQNPA